MKNRFCKKISYVALGLVLCIAFLRYKTKKYEWKLLFNTTLSCFRQLIREKDFNLKGYPGKINLLYKHVKLLTTSNISHSCKDCQTEKIGNFCIKYTKKTDLCPLLDEIFISKDYYFDTSTERPFIIDCGSHIGTSVLFFKMLYPGAKIICFEPTKHCFNLLSENVKQNNLEDVQLINKGVYYKEKEKKLYNPGTGRGSINFDSDRSGDYEKIKLTKLSEYITEKVDFLKMDIEGAETHVIKELAEAGKLKLINEMIMEFHFIKKFRKNRLSELLRTLEDNGFNYEISSNMKTPFEKAKEKNFLLHAYQRNTV